MANRRTIAVSHTSPIGCFVECWKGGQ